MKGAMMDLGDLFGLARQYGRVNLFTADDGTYSANIRFNTIEHTQLEAKSGHNHPTPDIALRRAIEAAERIVESITQMKMPERKLLG